MDADRLLAEEDAGWRELTELFGQVPQDRFEEPSVTPEGWSAKDVMFHVVAWLDEASEALDRERAGVPDPEGLDTEAKNARFLEISRTLGAEDVLSRMEPSRGRMLRCWAALDAVTPGAWEWLNESGPQHYAEHAKDLRAWIGQGGP
jgi:Mycothiol maleylpyruvate isomerase N-terminal domain